MRNKLNWVIFAILAIQSGCGGSSAPVALPDFPEKRTGDPNLDYWLFLNSEFSTLEAFSGNGNDLTSTAGLPSDFVMQSTVHRLLRASGPEVDGELVAWALKVANHYSEFSVWSSFMDQLAAEDRALQRHISKDQRRHWLAARMGSNLYSMNQALREEGENLRQALIAKYGREFPNSSF